MRMLDLWNSLSFFQAASMVAALILTVGAIVEYWGKLKPLARLFFKLVLLRSNSFERCVLRKLLLHSIAPLLVVLGIGGELLFESRSFIIEDQESTTLRTRTEHEIDARLILEKQFRSQGPRYLLLREAAPALVKELASFAGQRADLMICGTRASNDLETKSTWGTLANILGSDRVDGAKSAAWKLVRPEPFWDKCSLSMQGMTVFVSSVASKRTREAADALSKELLKVLPPYNKMPSVVEPQFIESALRFMDKDNPQRLAAGDPTLVVVFIGEHPPQ
jgi:hypothetical protein